MTTTTTSQLGDLSMVIRYLQAHKTYSSAAINSFSKHHTLDPTVSTSALPTSTALSLARTIQSLDMVPAKADEDEDEDSSASSRRRLKKKATRKLPIDEPSSSSCGGWVSSESDHKEEIMGRSSEEPDLAVLEDASYTQPPDTIATLTDFLVKELQQHYQQQQQQQQDQKLGQQMVSRAQQLNIHSLSTLTVAKSNHVTLPPPPTVATTNNKITASATAAVVSASVSGTGAVFIKKKRPWHTAKVLREMKAMFMEEQKRKHPQQQQLSLDNNRPANTSTEPNIAATTTTTTAVTLVTPPKTVQKKEEQELVLDQTPGYEPEFQWRPRSHYNNFWKSCTLASTTAGTTTDTNRSSSSSSSSEEESPLRFHRGCNIIPASSSSAFTFGSKTSARPTSCASETKSKNAESKRLLALRVRDTFLVPRGTNLLDQALSRAEAHLPGPVAPTPPQHEEKPKLTSTTRLELGTMKSLTRITTPLSGPPQLADKLRPAPATSTSTEQPKPDSTPSPPKSASATPSNERIFIFVDNSNILHGFYQNRQQLEAQRAADGILVNGTSSSTVRSRSEDGQDHYHHQDQVSPHKSPSHCSETLAFEDGMALVTPTTTADDDGPKSFPPGTGSNGTTGNSSNGNGTGPKAKMARGSHRLPKFNYSKFFDLLKRDRTAARQVLVGSSPLFQELDDAMEHQYETIILRRVKKFVQGELGAIPIPVKQVRFPPSNFSNGGAVVGPSSYCDGAELSVEKSTSFTTTNTVAPLTAAPTTTTAAGSGSSGGGSQGEQGVDELLHLKMLETLLDHEPATIVLASGDGGDSEFGGGGFYAVIKRALNRGWHVEVVSWEDQLSGVYLELALEYGYSCEHKLATTETATGESAGGKRCHALSSSSLETVVGGQKKQKKQQKYRPTGTKKQRALALALAQEKEKEKEEKENEGKQCERGHLRVWCLDWYGDILLQSTPTCTE
ncbi:hypothetical protein BG015_003741 [Linnemannia schmuckeri]|uniref:NYN domain-containing protein n=1 Tax=Linnemannia schmuckeri TaxID=64567 RepID=A0A9P5VDA1_9FUNG|nr:hypothetical protein BG015_003741 [Linnemannia schmuckeri]